MKEWMAKAFRLKKTEGFWVIDPGLYHFLRDSDGMVIRFHLRVEPDGSGVLLANASAAARLSHSGVVMAKGILDGLGDREILERIKGDFHGVEDAAQGLKSVKELIARLEAPVDNFPILGIGEAGFSPHEARLLAPYQADMVLAHPERLNPLLARLWDIGIPHACFLASEGLSNQDLIRAVERAEDLGLISGVRARGSDLLGAPDLLPALAEAGVDYITVPLAASDPGVHEEMLGAGDFQAARAALRRAIDLEVCPVAEIALVEVTMPVLEETIRFLTGEGVSNASFFAIAAGKDLSDRDRTGALGATGLPQAAALVEELAHEASVRFLWQPTVRRDPSRPLSRQVKNGPRCSGDVSIRIEPDGTVFPARGPKVSAGNLIRDEWSSIWNHQVFSIYRERLARPDRCDVCPGLAICDSGCPRDPELWSE